VDQGPGIRGQGSELKARGQWLPGRANSDTSMLKYFAFRAIIDDAGRMKIVGTARSQICFFLLGD
jgi:hypothetical protein